MKFRKFRILFATGIEFETDQISKKEAIIIAQAAQIQKGNGYEVKRVYEKLDSGLFKELNVLA